MECSRDSGRRAGRSPRSSIDRDADEQHRRSDPRRTTKGCPALTPGGEKHREAEIGKTMFAGNGMVQSIGPVRRSLLRMRATIRSAADAKRHGAYAGNRDRNKTKKNAENHSDPRHS